jgi:pimeloyl-ACP methyl ester carboxylesterase
MLGRLLFTLLALVGLAALVAVSAYFMLRRADIPYETLAARYETADAAYIDLPSGVRLHYQDQGAPDAPVLVLLHGFSASTHTWDAWTAELGGEYRIIRIDLPGHGLTRAPAGYQGSMEAFAANLEEFARAAQLPRFALAGNSMGGNVAWEYALAHPERLDALILVDASGWPPEDTTESEPIIYKLLRDPNARGLVRDLDNTSLFTTGLQSSFADPALATEDMITRYTELSRAPGHRDILAQLLQGFRVRNFATPERLAPLTTPTLIIQGAEDQLVPMSAAEAFRDAIPGAQLLIMDGVGHIPQEEAPEASAAAVRAFLAPLRQAATEPAAIAAQ